MSGTRGWRLAALLVIGACVGPGSRAGAELPPGSYDALRAAAQECLAIRVLSVVTTVEEQDAETGFIRHSLLISATVTHAKRTASGVEAGDTVQIDSYHIDPGTSGWVGPAIPPILAEGWTGDAYLNQVDTDPAYELAAYGRSFTESSDGSDPDGGGSDGDDGGGLALGPLGVVCGLALGALSVVCCRRRRRGRMRV